MMDGILPHLPSQILEEPRDDGHPMQKDATSEAYFLSLSEALAPGSGFRGRGQAASLAEACEYTSTLASDNFG